MQHHQQILLYLMLLLIKLGEASGIYKMASSLGGAFGVAISAAIYGAIAANKYRNCSISGNYCKRDIRCTCNHFDYLYGSKRCRKNKTASSYQLNL